MNKEMKITHHNGYSYLHVANDNVYYLNDDNNWIQYYESPAELFEFNDIKVYNGEPIRYEFCVTEGGGDVLIDASGEYVTQADCEQLMKKNKMLMDVLKNTQKLITQCCEDGIISEDLFLNQADLARVLREAG